MAKILHLIHSLSRGGIETWLMSMLRAVPRSEAQMDFCCKGASTGELAPLAQQLGARVFRCPLGPTHFSFARQLKRLLKEGDYQLLHCHLELYSGFPVWVARQLKVPVITSFHNTHFPPQMSWSRSFGLRQLRWLYGAVSIPYALRRSDLVTGCSRAVLESLDPDGKIIGPERSRVIHYGVPLQDLPTPQERTDFRASLGWSADAPLILHVGRFVEQKNHLGLLTVFERVKQRIPKAKLILVGDGILRPNVEKEVAARGLAEHVRLLGIRADAPNLMTKCDAFVLPSLHEGFPMVALEVAAAGLPLVGSRIPGLTEAVQEGVTALLHDVNDIQGMACSVASILTDPEVSQRLRDGGRAWVGEHLSLEASARRLLETYRLFVPIGMENRRTPQLLTEGA